MNNIEEKLRKWPVSKQCIGLCESIILPGFQGLSLYILLKTYFIGIVKGTFSSRAGSIAFSFFMALFPFLLILLNMIPYVPIDNFQERFLKYLGELLPQSTHDYFFPIIEDIAGNPRGGLLSVVFLLTLFLMTNGVNAIFSGFEYSFHVKINRSFFKQYFVALVVSVFFALLLILTVVAGVYSEYLITSLRESDYISNDLFWLKTARYSIFVIMIYMIVAVLYYFGIKDNKSSRFFSIGALVSTLLFLLTTFFFGMYIDNFNSYNELYGSIGALLIMMLYIWINSNLLLLGFELNASIKILKSKH